LIYQRYKYGIKFDQTVLKRKQYLRKDIFMKKILTIVVFISLSFTAILQTQWISRYNGPGNSIDEAFSVVSDISGNIYVTGSSTGSGSNLDYATIKYNSSGTEQWVVRYNGPANFIDIANAIAVDGAGNVYVTGTSSSSTLSDYATVKYNSSGQELWVARYNGPVSGTDEAFSVAVDGAGNVYVTGQSLSGTNYDYATIKYNSSGQQQWAARYNGPQNSVDNGAVVRVDAAGNVYVTGGSTGSGGGLDYATIKYNSAGQQQWAARYNGTGNSNDVASDLAVDVAGNVYVTGGSSGSGSSNDYATIKYNSSGQEQWAARYNGTGNDNDVASSLALSAAGNVYVTGSSIGSGSSSDYATLMYNNSGAAQWTMRYNGPNNTTDDATSVAVDGSGNAFVTGSSNSGGTNLDYLTLKYSISGQQVWEQRYNGPGNGIDAALSIAIDPAGSIFITGNSQGSGSSSDFATLKYANVTAIEPVGTVIPSMFKLYENYPNPFNPVTTIKFDVPKQSFARLVIYDVTGRTVSTAINEDLKPGAYEYVFDAAGIASGVYFYKISAGDFNDVKKMILLK
jgi:hypothetical protein